MKFVEFCMDDKAHQTYNVNSSNASDSINRDGGVIRLVSDGLLEARTVSCKVVDQRQTGGSNHEFDLVSAPEWS